MRIMRIIIIVLLSISAGAAGAYLRLQPYIYPSVGDIYSEFKNIDRTVPDELSGTISILIAGLDSTDGTERADSIAIVIIDIDTKKVKLLSIPRDSRVLIPRRGWDKINHAYAYGKIDLLKEVTVNLLGVPIDYYLVLNFKSFPAIVDLLGGVTIDVEKRLVYNDYAGKLHIDIPKGIQTLDGKNALHYVRFRHDSLADLGRITRQQRFAKEVLKKLQTPLIIPKIPDLIAESLQMVNTDMSPMQALQLVSYMRNIEESDINFFTLPGKAANIGALSYWLPDIPSASMLLADHFIPDSPEDNRVDFYESREDIPLLLSRINGKISVLNGDGARGLVKRASEELQQIGIDVGITGNAKHFDYRSSCIMIPSNGNQEDLESAEALAALCGISNKLISKNATTSSVTIIIGKDKESIFTNLRAAATK
ncbi:MAG: LCP family protein [Synergistaceae bacterium]|nr:LCP family protein [Synergistaceae bacterium]